MKLPRFFHWLYANMNGYFWLPCPICGKNFGGHEWAESLWTSPSRGRGVCPNCVEEARKRNEKNNYFRHSASTNYKEGE